MDILFLSHCVPNPPDKGEKIRVHHQLNALAAHHRVHLACFARTPEDVAAAHALEDRCASVFVVPLFPFLANLARGAARFAFGACLNSAFYTSAALQRHVRKLRVGASFAYSAVAARYAPGDLPLILDYIDVDSEKWFQYAKTRKPAVMFQTEAVRIRQLEIEQGARSRMTLLTTQPERALLATFSDAPALVLENGVDFAYFDPEVTPDDPDLARRRYVLFSGSMDYFPNADAVCRFAKEEFSALRAADPALEFLIVGRNPTPDVQALTSVAGVRVTGAVADMRPYYKHAQYLVAPLRIARGIQNKVLEALAMDKPVVASPEILGTFGDTIPSGVGATFVPLPAQQIRESARARFTWETNLKPLLDLFAAL